LLVYPCNYLGEINCIALTKAIATGCIAVTNDHPIMVERNVYGTVSNDKFKDHLIATLKNKPDCIDTKEYIKNNSWEAVAKDWDSRLFKFDRDIVVSDRQEWIWKNVKKTDKILDIGSNQGHLFSGWDRTNIHSVDIDKYDLPNFTQADAQKPLPFNDKEFDIAVLGEILEHTDNPVDVLREAMRVCNKLIITVPWEHQWPSKLLPFATAEDRMKDEGVKTIGELARKRSPAVVAFHDGDEYKHLFHKQFFTPESLKKCLDAAEIVDYRICEIRCGDWVWIGAVCGSN
jgi:ubiquinone/menaquinone biosynthesis C-methylase UbiE